MAAILRDAPAGQLARLALKTVFLYPDEKEGFSLPMHPKPVSNNEYNQTALRGDEEKAADLMMQPDRDTSSTGTQDSSKQIIDWYGPEDPENPQNWSARKKSFVFFQIALLTFVVYLGSAIITPAQTIFMQLYGVSAQVSSLPLSLYILGYGLGPLFFSPLSEVPKVGRNAPYMISFALFILITVGTSRVDNFPGLVVLRFIQGFLGGPVLATGGASVQDMLGFHKVPYGLTVWLCAAYGGPSLGPVLSAFAVTDTWRWTMYELLILSGLTFILLFFFLPETNPETILLKRAQRIRRRFSNPSLRSDAEIKQGNVHIVQVMANYLTTPFRVTVQDPSIAFINIYTALIYAIYYSYFESFPLVFIGIYGFSLGLTGVVFLSIIVACAIGLVTYLLLLRFIYEPYTLKFGIGVPEHRLVPGVIAAATAPIGIFIFAWTSRPEIHWIVPVIGIVFFSTSQFFLFNVILIYLPTSYPRYAASLFAANSFFRSVLAAAAIHFSKALFDNLGVGRGCSVLGGLTAGCFFGVLGLWKYGPTLRAKSNFAETY
ncbi:cycloheximide resistance protein [Xylaria acuta]|nr:cycloheximide resistance protein [Xylaria acuta]